MLKKDLLFYISVLKKSIFVRSWIDLPGWIGYRDQMNSQNFEKLIEEKVIPNPPSNSIVIMAQVLYLCIQLDKPQTKIIC